MMIVSSSGTNMNVNWPSTWSWESDPYTKIRLVDRRNSISQFRWMSLKLLSLMMSVDVPVSIIMGTGMLLTETEITRVLAPLAVLPSVKRYSSSLLSVSSESESTVSSVVT